MIQGMAQMQFEKMPGFKDKLKNSIGSNEKSFGSMLETMKVSKTMSESEENKLGNPIAELLKTTTPEELFDFYQENIASKIKFSSLQDGEFVFLPDNLQEMMPAFELEEADLEAMAASPWSYFEQLNEMASALNTEIAQGHTGIDALSKEQMIHLLAFLQLATFEPPEFDITLKQEQQREALRKNLQNIGGLLESISSKASEEGSLRLPFVNSKLSMQANGEAGAQHSHLNEITTKTVGQSTLSFGGLPKVEGLLNELEARESSRAQLLLRELQNVFKRSHFGQLNGTNRITVKMYPEHLGQLRIELLQTNGLLTARILASNALGKEMLESQLHQLRNAFLQQNIQVERIDISQMLNDTTYLDREHAFGQQFKNEQDNAKEQKSEQDEEEQISFEQYLIELEV